MKKTVFFLLAIFLFIGCSKDSENDDQPKAIDKTANLKATGSSANDILSNTNFNKLAIEIAYVKNYMPSDDAITGFLNFIKARTFKNNITVTYKEQLSPNEATLTLEKVAELEAENRTIYNDDDTLSIYIYFADAPSDDDNPDEDLVTLGAVFRNTSMVIYEKTIKELAAKSALITEAAIEESTLNHELGHLMGLVNLGSTMVHEHEDAGAENHCNIDGCLMSAQLTFGRGAKKMLIANKNAPPSLDAECLADLKANGGR